MRALLRAGVSEADVQSAVEVQARLCYARTQPILRNDTRSREREREPRRTSRACNSSARRLQRREHETQLKRNSYWLSELGSAYCARACVHSCAEDAPASVPPNICAGSAASTSAPGLARPRMRRGCWVYLRRNFSAISLLCCIQL
jgi:hypothetical protein